MGIWTRESSRKKKNKIANIYHIQLGLPINWLMTTSKELRLQQKFLPQTNFELTLKLKLQNSK